MDSPHQTRGFLKGEPNQGTWPLGTGLRLDGSAWYLRGPNSPTRSSLRPRIHHRWESPWGSWRKPCDLEMAGAGKGSVWGSFPKQSPFALGMRSSTFFPQSHRQASRAACRGHCRVVGTVGDGEGSPRLELMTPTASEASNPVSQQERAPPPPFPTLSECGSPGVRRLGD